MFFIKAPFSEPRVCGSVSFQKGCIRIVVGTRNRMRSHSEKVTHTPKMTPREPNTRSIPVKSTEAFGKGTFFEAVYPVSPLTSLKWLIPEFRKKSPKMTRPRIKSSSIL